MVPGTSCVPQWQIVSLLEILCYRCLGTAARRLIFNVELQLVCRSP